MSLLRRVSRSPALLTFTGIVASHYLRLVWNTSRFVVEPEDIYDRIRGDLPVIIAMWHGQHFMMPFIKKPEHRAKVLISRHRDGEINAVAAERLGIGTIRGVESRGMLCSAAELMISDDHDGIIELPADAPVGARYADWAKLGDPVIEINLTPNRQDATGVHGIAAISPPPTWAS